MAKQTASGRGPRKAKLTLLVPVDVMDDLRALRMITSQSTGDFVNEIIEDGLRRRSALVEKGRELVRVRDELMADVRPVSKPSGGSVGRAAGAPSAASSGTAGGKAAKVALGPGESMPVPSEGDLRAWAAEASGDDATKRRKEGERFLGFLRSKGCDRIREDVLLEYKAEILDPLYPNSRTASTRMALVNGFVRWSKGRL